MQQYKGAMDNADLAVVFYSKHALELKRLPDLPADKILAGFDKKNLVVINDKQVLLEWLQKQSYSHANLLLMSSGNYDGIDMLTFATQITQ